VRAIVDGHKKRRPQPPLKARAGYGHSITSLCRRVNYSDPFGLCALEKPLCPREYEPGVIGKTLMGIAEGAKQFWAAHGDAVVDVGMVLMTRGGGGGRGGFNSRTVARTEMGRTKVRVDVELPGTHGPGNVHVQTKGPGGPQKYPVSDPSDLSGLPRTLRENEIIQKGIEKAFDILKRWQQ